MWNNETKTTYHAALMRHVKGLDDDALRFVIQDCKRAIEAMPDNPKVGHYSDEIHYCAMELRRRGM